MTESNHRQLLLSMPEQNFCGCFGGRLPTQSEKERWIEETVKNLNPECLFANDTYRVGLFRRLPYIHLVIQRLDGGTCKEWRELQQIKNEIVGSEHEAVELFPAESRLMDTANEYHLWVLSDPKVRFQFGWWKRCVSSSPLSSSVHQPRFESAAGDGRLGITLRDGCVPLPSTIVFQAGS
jgi:hypothetical protein